MYLHVQRATSTYNKLIGLGSTGSATAKVPVAKSSLDSSDVFILDQGLTIYQWNGKTCNKDEKFKAVQYLQTLKSERGGKPKVESLDEREISSDHIFYTYLPDEEEPDDQEKSEENFEKKLLRLSDSSGNMELTVAGEGSAVSKDLLDSSDVFILDNSKKLFVWIGKSASFAENKNAKTHAHNYLKTRHPLIPVTLLYELVRNKKNHEEFNTAIAA